MSSYSNTTPIANLLSGCWTSKTASETSADPDQESGGSHGVVVDEGSRHSESSNLLSPDSKSTERNDSKDEVMDWMALSGYRLPDAADPTHPTHPAGSRVGVSLGRSVSTDTPLPAIPEWSGAATATAATAGGGGGGTRRPAETGRRPHLSGGDPPCRTSSAASLTVTPGSIKAQIEIIPCKVCGDKSSGVHYGVITCEGCKGFFRRSQSSVVNYQCPRQKNCVVDRVNRNRCQYCRLQKCLQLGMSRDAVKFGRMSKKQREKVEDEVRYHQEMHSHQQQSSSPSLCQTTTSTTTPRSRTHTTSGSSPDTTASSLFETTTTTCVAAPAPAPPVPTATVVSTEQPNVSQHHFPSSFSPAEFGQAFFTSATSANSSSMVSNEGWSEYGNVDSTTSHLIPEETASESVENKNSFQVKQESNSVVLQPAQTQLESSNVVINNGGFVDSSSNGGNWNASQLSNGLFLLQQELQNDPDRIGIALANSIFEAHSKTSLMSQEELDELFSQGVDPHKLFQFRSLTSEETWQQSAQRLTSIIRQIIEFAKLVPGFMQLPQDDQIVLLKGGVFELAVIRMCKLVNLSSKTVLCLDTVLPMEALINSSESGPEVALVKQVIDFARTIAELHLSDIVLALFSAYILFQDDRPGLRNQEEVRKLNQAILQTMQRQIRVQLLPVKMEELSVVSTLIAKRNTLREMSLMHEEALRKLRRTSPTALADFPDLHQEVFPAID